VTALSIMRLVEQGGGRITAGRMLFAKSDGSIVDLAQASSAAMRDIRGDDIAMVFQEPMTSLNPVMTAGVQIAESIRLHQHKDARAARAEALRMLEQVRIPEARAILDRYPHQLSGGMRQRVMIAMALSCRPEILIADEPTTALDVTVQAQILSLLRDLRTRTRAALILVTHDLGVIAEVADRVAVMYAGRIVEQARAERLFAAPRHPYTEGLRNSIVELSGPLPEKLPSIEGKPPDPGALPPGCAFAPRCPYVFARCLAERPPLAEVEPEHSSACFYDGPLGRFSR
ncbi:MAG: ABC transporter ATP-binding protein, partial [Steroidobacteraceae bacterium]